MSQTTRRGTPVIAIGDLRSTARINDKGLKISQLDGVGHRASRLSDEQVRLESLRRIYLVLRKALTTLFP